MIKSRPPSLSSFINYRKADTERGGREGRERGEREERGRERGERGGERERKRCISHATIKHLYKDVDLIETGHYLDPFVYESFDLFLDSIFRFFVNNLEM